MSLNNTQPDVRTTNPVPENGSLLPTNNTTNNNYNSLSHLLQVELENFFQDVYNAQLPATFLANDIGINTREPIIRDIPVNPMNLPPVSNENFPSRDISNFREIISSGAISDTRTLIETLLSQGRAGPSQPDVLGGGQRTNNNIPLEPEPEPEPEHYSNNYNYSFGNVLTDTLNQMHMNMNEYHNNVRTYQQNVQEIINMLREINLNNRTPARSTTTRPRAQSRIWTNPNISYYLYHPTRIAPTTQTPQTNLTEAQINLATRIVPYTNRFTETRCAISFEDFTENEEITQIIPCGHIFKTTYLNTWFQRRNSCPTCRYDLSNYRPSEPTIPPANQNTYTTAMEIEVEVETIP
jgi:hypothetical protein